jgi:hypothetical protein
MSAARTAVRGRTLAVAVAAAGMAGGLAAAPPATAAGTAAHTSRHTAARTAAVNVVHGIPGVVVKICVNGRPVADHVRYGQTLVGARLAARTQHVRLVPAGKACRTPAILKAAYHLRAGRNYTIVANLDAHGTPHLKAFRNNVRRTAPGTARLTVRHTAAAPAVNVWAGQTRLISGTGFTWGSSARFAVPAGRYSITVTLPGSTQPVIGPAPARLRAGRAYQVYAVGSPDHYKLVTVKVRVGTR